MSTAAGSPSSPTWPAHRVHQVDVAAGLRLLVRDWGPTDGYPVIHHHGTPSCSLAVPGGWECPDEVGVRVVTFDRPGYGDSPDLTDRVVADAGNWTRAIADELGLDRMALLGSAGGGPHAAAAAAALGDRVDKLCLLSAVGPDELPGFDPAADALPETRYEIACARAGETQLRRFVGELTARVDPLAAWFARLRSSDVEILGRGDVRAEELAIQEGAMKQGLEGWVQDDLALFNRPWGFDLANVTAETLLLYGLENVLVAAAHGDAYRLAFGHGQLVKVPDAGHWMRDYESDVLRWLSSSVPGPARMFDSPA